MAAAVEGPGIQSSLTGLNDNNRSKNQISEPFATQH